MKQSRRIYAALTAASLSVALFLLANLIVTSGRLIWIINSATDDVEVHYASATGTVLTQFRFTDLQVNGHDSKVSWKIHLEEATVSPSIFNLTRKIFETSQLVGKGLSFRLEFKDAGQTAESPSKESDYLGNWRIRIHGIQLDRIAAIQIGRYSLPAGGQTSLRSSFDFWPDYELLIDSSHFQSKNKYFRADLKFGLEHLRFKASRGLNFLHHLSAELTMDGESDDLGFINYYFHAVPWLGIHGDGAHLNALIRVDHGRVESSSHAEAEAAHLILTAGHLKAIGSGEVKFASQGLKVHFNQFHMVPNRAQGESLDFSIQSKNVDLADPLAEARQAHVSAKRASIHLFNSVIKTDLLLDAELRKIDSSHSRMEVPELRLGLSALSLADAKSPRSPQVKDWWLKVGVHGGVLDSETQPKFSGVANLSSLDGKPLAIFLKNAKVLPINLAGVVPMHDLSAETTFSFRPGSLRFDDFHLHSSTLQGEGHLEIKGENKFGFLAVKNLVHSFRLDFTGKDTKLNW